MTCQKVFASIVIFALLGMSFCNIQSAQSHSAADAKAKAQLRKEFIKFKLGRRDTNPYHPPDPSTQPIPANGYGFGCDDNNGNNNVRFAQQTCSADTAVIIQEFGYPPSKAGFHIDFAPQTFSSFTYVDGGNPATPYAAGVTFVFSGTQGGNPVQLTVCGNPITQTGNFDCNGSPIDIISTSTAPQLAGLTVSSVDIVLYGSSLGAVGEFFSSPFTLNGRPLALNINLTQQRTCPPLPPSPGCGETK